MPDEIKRLVYRKKEGRKALSVGSTTWDKWMSDGTLDVVRLGPRARGATAESVHRVAKYGVPRHPTNS